MSEPGRRGNGAIGGGVGGAASVQELKEFPALADAGLDEGGVDEVVAAALGAETQELLPPGEGCITAGAALAVQPCSRSLPGGGFPPASGQVSLALCIELSEGVEGGLLGPGGCLDVLGRATPEGFSLGADRLKKSFAGLELARQAVRQIGQHGDQRLAGPNSAVSDAISFSATRSGSMR